MMKFTKCHQPIKSHTREVATTIFISDEFRDQIVSLMPSLRTLHVVINRTYLYLGFL